MCPAQCFGGDNQKVCVFHNLLLWNDTFYYATPGLLLALILGGTEVSSWQTSA